MDEFKPSDKALSNKITMNNRTTVKEIKRANPLPFNLTRRKGIPTQFHKINDV